MAKERMSRMHCPGCRFGFWYAFGALLALKPPEDTTLTGVSGGALAAACYLCGLDPERQLEVCQRLRSDLVASWDLQGTVRRWLTDELPEDCVALCGGRLVVYTRRYPCLEVRAFDRWRDKAHLVETLVAAASPVLPLNVDGEWLTDCLWIHTDDPVLPVPHVWGFPDLKEARQMFCKGQLDFS